MLTPALLPLLLLTADPPRTIYGAPREMPDVVESPWSIGGNVATGWSSDYVFRGFEILEPGGREDSGNYYLDAQLTLERDNRPVVYVELFANAAESDPLVEFQTYQPTIAATGRIDALQWTVGHTSFFYPERPQLRSNEVFVEFEYIQNTAVIDDDYWQPFVLAAYDYDRFDGLYAEAGLRLFVPMLEPAYLNFEAAVAAVADHDQFGGSGLQHYRVGVTAGYELNELLNVSRSRGRVSIEGTLVYTDGIDDDLASTTQLHGGVGVRLQF
ncbi:MAG: hypothetical protein AAF656_04240 [Planctomycetota bacterium]